MQNKIFDQGVVSDDSDDLLKRLKALSTTPEEKARMRMKEGEETFAPPPLVKSTISSPPAISMPWLETAE
ncbi:MAG: hypothetical protein IPM23_07405 [Candidatus Melainabacteria bacterium]|nr:hypothetical protein [Candidatus Melainabacteria bacterium]